MFGFGNCEFEQALVRKFVNTCMHKCKPYIQINAVKYDSFTYNPWRIMPIRIIVSFLGALITTSRSPWVLAGVDGSWSIKLFICSEQSHIAPTQSTIDVVIVCFVHSIPDSGYTRSIYAFMICYLLNILIAVEILTEKQAVRYSGGRGSVPYVIGAHVLEDNLAVVVGVPARMLVGPLHRQYRPSVVIQTPNIIATTIVIL